MHSHDHLSLVDLTVRDGVAVVSMNDLKTSNAMTVSMASALAERFEQVRDLNDVHCVLLRSGAKHFCTGGNVVDMAQGEDLMAGDVAAVHDRLAGSLHRVTLATQALPVPTIAAVKGRAIGAGLDLALMQDLRIASDKARFAESFLRLGLISGIGGAWFLSRVVGPARAMELTLSAEFIDATDALRHGLVSRVVPDDQLDQVAWELALRTAGMPPRALRQAKRLVRESAACSLTAALEMAGAMQAILLAGSEHKAAVKHFIDAMKS